LTCQIRTLMPFLWQASSIAGPSKKLEIALQLLGGYQLYQNDVRYDKINLELFFLEYKSSYTIYNSLCTHTNSPNDPILGFVPVVLHMRRLDSMQKTPYILNIFNFLKNQYILKILNLWLTSWCSDQYPSKHGKVFSDNCQGNGPGMKLGFWTWNASGPTTVADLLLAYGPMIITSTLEVDRISLENMNSLTILRSHILL
jgi:hypothetical protein